MGDSQTQLIDVSLLRVGMYVHLDIGWMDHPFSLNSFRIQAQEQIDVIRSLGIERIRYAPDKSDPESILPGIPAEEATPGELEQPPSDAEPEPHTAIAPPAQAAKQWRRDILAKQHTSLQVCERQFAGATRAYKQIAESVHGRPEASREQAESLIHGFVSEILGDHEACIRLLSEKAGDKGSLHSVNVTVISLLLGRAAGLGEEEMLQLGVGALLHDIGKSELPARLRRNDDDFLDAERQIYREHVAHGIALAGRMGLPENAILAIAQHHEFEDGSGYPGRIKGDAISPLGRIVAIVNHYDNLCNPFNPARALTPHEALSLMFTQMKSKFYATTMAQFIRMMGVYPPGSVVQLTDQRYALVVSVNSTRPLRPHIAIHDPQVPRDETIVVDLETEPDIGIRRSLKPLQLPRSAYDYLSPRKRMCYFFERAVEVESETP